jgi:omega-6 fatty acid desaturase (delta-12 desaturase)
MNIQNTSEVYDTIPKSARNWVPILAKYRDPCAWRSSYELGITLACFLGLWTLAWLALSVSAWLALAIALVNGLFLVRLFAIQHDCGHSAFYKNSHVSNWVGRALGVLTLTPYDIWRRAHSIHHAGSGNLDKREMGEIKTLTVEEYRARTSWGRFLYRLYRSPIVLFGLGPGFVFILQNRLPFGFMSAGAKYWLSAMGTNLGLALALGLVFYFGGLAPVFLIFLPTSLMAATIGVWLFYVQHQFEEAHWDKTDDWQVHEAALHGSSHYVMPKVLQWATANIGIHHVHHLYSRIPFYRLTEVLRDHADLANAQKLTIRESIATVGLQLWDERQRRLLSFREANALYG